ncbi:MAG TPA: hypothetical protein VMT30_06800 [Candidatus Saccharimonadia bacterium]|nr:hypothetical protein [Candidatus Saccharimonadia bacterium]
MLPFLVVALVGGVVLYGVVENGSRKGRKRSRPVASSRGYRGFVDPTEIKTRWDTIMAISNTGASGLKSSLNEADKLFDHVMKSLGFAGDTMGERLKHGRSRFADHDAYQAVWRAHKLRNALAHEIGFDLVPSQAKDALADFERGLRALGALR